VNDNIGANQTIRINIDGWSIRLSATLIATFLRKTGQAAARLEKQPNWAVQLPRLHGPRPEQHHAACADIRYH
jgi:hypothetical protein